MQELTKQAVDPNRENPVDLEREVFPFQAERVLRIELNPTVLATPAGLYLCPFRCGARFVGSSLTEVAEHMHNCSRNPVPAAQVTSHSSRSLPSAQRARCTCVDV